MPTGEIAIRRSGGTPGNDVDTELHTTASHIVGVLRSFTKAIELLFSNDKV
jgi:hypothetical protein